MTQIIENKTCKQCSIDFPIYQEDQDFYDKISPTFAGERFQIPRPTLCPDCREQRRLGIWNERNLYKRLCNATGREIISMYSPDKTELVYDQDFWWSDNWETPIRDDAFDYSIGFFSQFSDLLSQVPKRALVKGTGSENCNYTNCLGAGKNSYLAFNGSNSTDCAYIDGMSEVDSCIDCSQIRKSHHCYESVDVIGCTNCQYIQDCENCNESKYLLHCINCNNCFSCVNLNNKQYCIFNIQYTKQEYEVELKKIVSKGYTREDFLQYTKKFPHTSLKITASENVSGNIIHNASHVSHSYEVYDSQDIYYSTNIYKGASDCMDGNTCLNESSRLYEMSLANKFCDNLLFCHDCWNTCQNLLYCTECKLCKDCFGCTGLVGKQYCILNSQYTKQEYEKEMMKIIQHMQQSGEWGEFFPLSISPFGYNESSAQHQYPLTREEAFAKGFNWSDYNIPAPKVEKVIPADKLPKDISDIPDDILNWAISCEITQKPFRIIKPELEFYRKHGLPVPHRHPNQRHLDRMKLRNPRKLFERQCDKCSQNMQTTYAPERLEIVYCQDCYNKEIY